MVGYKLGVFDWERIANDPNLQRLICRYCKFLVKQPMVAATCRHTFCLSCLESNCKIVPGLPPVAVCPEDNQELHLREFYPDEQADKEVKSLVISCTCTFNGESCEWRGPLGKLEMHLKDFHHHPIGEERKATSHHDMQFSRYPLLSTLPQVAGPSGVSLLNSQQSLQENQRSDNSRYHDSARPDAEQSWSESQTLQDQQRMDHNVIVLLTQQISVLSDSFATVKHQCERLQDTVQGKVHILEQKQSMDHTAIEQLKQQLAAFGDALVKEKQDHERLLQDHMRTVEGKVQVQDQKQTMDQQQRAALSVAFERLQDEVRTAEGKVQALEERESVNQNDIEQLKQQLAVFDTERHDCERLQDDVRTVEGKVQVLDQELEAQKVRCTTARTECETERARTYDDLNMESGILQDYIGRLQERIANLKAQLMRVQNERRQGSNGEGL